jgi:hypothetical protein
MTNKSLANEVTLLAPNRLGAEKQPLYVPSDVPTIGRKETVPYVPLRKLSRLVKRANPSMKL